MALPPDTAVDLCASADLVERGMALPFDVVFSGQTWRAFAIRYQGVAYAYLTMWPWSWITSLAACLMTAVSGCYAAPMVQPMHPKAGNARVVLAVAAWSKSP